MGAGKSDVGRRVASALSRSFVDLDTQVEMTAAARVADIFELEGEAGFRRREAEALAHVTDEARPSVIATGGGVIESATNRAILANRCLVVWLRAGIPTLVDRVGSGRGRPLLRGSETPTEVLERLSRHRDPWYESLADFVIDTDGLTAGQVAEELLSRLAEQVPA